MEHRLKRSLIALLALFYLTPSLASTSPETFAHDPDVAAFVAEMAERHGFDAIWLNQRFARIAPNETVLRAIRPAAVPELQRSWERYRSRFLNERRIEAGVRFWQEHSITLKRAGAIYGIPEEIIVAIIGVETEYGRNTGRFGVMQALSTLAFRYPPRAPYFRGELEQFLLLARENGYDPMLLKGSYAGAIGIPQFMPGSQRHYAVDFDGDGRIDLTGSAADAIGSVARFLAMHGWETGADIAVPARVGTDPAPLIEAGIRPVRPLAELVSKGVEARGTPEAPGALIDLATPGKETEYWVGFQNFYVITRYNRSSFYAMSVFQLAEAIRQRKG